MTDKAISGTDSRENDRLLPCPFCGGEATLNIAPYIGGGGFGHIVECDKCWSKTGYYSKKAEAVAAWNMRAGGVCAFAEPTDLTDGCSLLRDRTCRMERIGDEKRILHGWMECSECGPVYPPANEHIQDAVKFCPFCGRKVV